MKLSIGSIIWWWDVNLRVYHKDQAGRSVGGSIWREHWRPREVIGETSRSWLIGRHYDEKPPFVRRVLYKLPKDKPLPAGYAVSEAEIDEKAWAVENQYAISEAVRRADDVGLLRKVAELIGYVENLR